MIEEFKRKTTSEVWVTTDFVGFHHWPEAPEEVLFLRSPHRHKFFVKLAVTVGHDDREVEFFILQRWLKKQIEIMNKSMKARKSCENMAEFLINQTMREYGVNRRITCTISEDNENGATLTYDPKAK